MKISEKGQKLLANYKKFQKIYILLLAVAAMSFVFLHNYYFAVALAVFTFVLETKYYKCPHCKKSLNSRKKIAEDSCCPNCNKYIFKDLD
ncbi:hypothetical protein [Anaerotignum propionicum]|uniref:hypothetical protein n=2 Tax=Anaerotignum TaxID=2039240 RepID=UPI00210AD275|nr:hypothetical protein [Anaerotignum propionicum]MCQ4935510.1 hypothetical protein [Anaerotignum propionicum]